MTNCTIIGISDRREQWFPPEVLDVIGRGFVFSGGKRHHEIMMSFLPEKHTWIDITVPIADVFKKYEQHEDIVIFASGDPLFYGFAATVKRECPDCKMTVYPSFNSLQMLAHRINMPYQDMRCVSLTGRPWNQLDEALIRGERLIGCLTDHNKTPDHIWQRMKDYGYTNYRIIVGEKLGNEAEERISEYQEGTDYSTPNCIILERTSERIIPFGIPDEQFELLNGREKMITKWPIRLATLSVLGLQNKHSLWDIGFCTGSISIEAKLRFPWLNITAFEIREEGHQLMKTNSRRFGTPGINAIIGDFMNADISQLNPPDAVFIGGHGGKMSEIFAKAKSVLKTGGCIVFNSVSEHSKQLFIEAAEQNGMKWQICQTIQTNDNNPICILKAESPRAESILKAESQIGI